MRYPKLVRNPRTPVRVVIGEAEPNEFNERPVILDKTFLCNYQDCAERRYSSEKYSPEVTGVIYIDGDIFLKPSANVSAVSFTEPTLTDEGILIYPTQLILSGDGEIQPVYSEVIAAGYVEIFGERRAIKRGTKGRNLDGSVNYTKIEVI